MATSCDSNLSNYKWTRDSTFARVEFVDETPIGIVNEGYIEPYGREEVGIINLKCSGKLCVDKDDPLCKGEFVANPKDESDKLIMYELHIATESRDKDHLQPRYILLECQAKKHHLLHCSWTGPPASATFKEFPRYDSNVPKVDINDSSDQKFIWVIPPKGGNEFSLKPYNQSCYLTCMETENDIKAVVREGGNDEADSSFVEEHS